MCAQATCMSLLGFETRREIKRNCTAMNDLLRVKNKLQLLSSRRYQVWRIKPLQSTRVPHCNAMVLRVILTDTTTLRLNILLRHVAPARCSVFASCGARLLHVVANNAIHARAQRRAWSPRCQYPRYEVTVDFSGSSGLYCAAFWSGSSASSTC
ncbi:hypothetical protein B0H12DRAFT_712833 [Mycena haematopus]|nr:hypothetical protein B0H12DRAFT_712833 [Mycena haematopus]